MMLAVVWRRRLLTICSILSLLLCIGVCGLWVWSFFDPVVYRFDARGERSEAVLMRGQFKVSNAPEVVAQALARRRSQQGVPATMPFAGPRFWSHSSLSLGPALITILAVLPAVAARRWRARRRYLQAGLCPTCGYDLRATPDRCPECGRAVATSR